MKGIDIVALIKACAEVGVAHLRFGELEVDFKGVSAAPFHEREPAAVEDIAGEINQEIIEREIEDLIISDPLSYENELLKGKNSQ